MTTKTKTAAIRQAKKEITMYRQGGGWITSAYDARVQCQRTSCDMSYWMALSNVAQSRAERVYELMTGSAYAGGRCLNTIDDAVQAATKSMTKGSK